MLNYVMWWQPFCISDRHKNKIVEDSARVINMVVSEHNHTETQLFKQHHSNEAQQRDIP